jgi:hypothetical protein
MRIPRILPQPSPQLRVLGLQHRNPRVPVNKRSLHHRQPPTQQLHSGGQIGHTGIIVAGRARSSRHADHLISYIWSCVAVCAVAALFAGSGLMDLASIVGNVTFGVAAIAVSCLCIGVFARPVLFFYVGGAFWLALCGIGLMPLLTPAPVGWLARTATFTGCLILVAASGLLLAVVYARAQQKQQQAAMQTMRQGSWFGGAEPPGFADILLVPGVRGFTRVTSLLSTCTNPRPYRGPP